MPRQQLSPKTVEKRMKERRALELRLAGATYEWIAQELGYQGPSGAWYAVKRAMKRLGPDEVAGELRRLTYIRLERLLMALWAPATRGGVESKKRPNLKAQDRALRIIARECELMGLDMPKEFRHEMGGPITLKVIRAVPRPEDGRDDARHEDDISADAEAGGSAQGD